MTVVLALVAGLAIGLSLGTLGGGGSILAVPVLYLLGQSAGQATTGSLVVVGVTSLTSATTAHRAGHVMLGRGLTFGIVATGGAIVGARAAIRVPEDVLLAAFAMLMLLVGGLMVLREVRSRLHHDVDGGCRGAALDGPIITFSPRFACQCPRAMKVLVTATAVGLLTGFLGVGGGFLVVPALLVALAIPIAYAAGTSLVAISITSAVALAVRAGSGVAPDWAPVLALTIAAVVGGVLGARLVGRVDPRRLSTAFTTLVVVVAGYTVIQAVPGLV